MMHSTGDVEGIFRKHGTTSSPGGAPQGTPGRSPGPGRGERLSQSQPCPLVFQSAQLLQLLSTTAANNVFRWRQFHEHVHSNLRVHGLFHVHAAVTCAAQPETRGGEPYRFTGRFTHTVHIILLRSKGEPSSNCIAVFQQVRRAQQGVRVNAPRGEDISTCARSARRLKTAGQGPCTC